MLKFDDILLLLDKLNNQPEEKIQSGGAIIRIKVKMKPWMGDPMDPTPETHWVPHPGFHFNFYAYYGSTRLVFLLWLVIKFIQ